MVCGGWGDAEKSYASMCVEFLLFGREKSQENNIFRVFNTCNSSPILLFCPRNPKFCFLENPKRRVPENDRDLSFQKLIWSHMMPFGVNSDASFRAQKRSIRVRVSSFRTAGTVVSLTPTPRRETVFNRRRVPGKAPFFLKCRYWDAWPGNRRGT